VALLVAKLTEIVSQHTRNYLQLKPLVLLCIIFFFASKQLLDRVHAFLKRLVSISLDQDVQLIVRVKLDLFGL
jgi:hypothetical protein